MLNMYSFQMITCMYQTISADQIAVSEVENFLIFNKKEYGYKIKIDPWEYKTDKDKLTKTNKCLSGVVVQRLVEILIFVMEQWTYTILNCIILPTSNSQVGRFFLCLSTLILDYTFSGWTSTLEPTKRFWSIFPLVSS